jgi:sulfonate transport system substrate-binding protein
MQRVLFLIGFGLAVSGLKLASDLESIEYTPARVALEEFFNSTHQLVTGGISVIGRDETVDLATNAEIPSLRAYATNRNLRIIYTVTETYYRIVANKSAGITKLEDLAGKRIGTIPGTTANYFLEQYLATVGITASNYTLVSGGLCKRNPCASNTLPGLLANNSVDAITVWEPTPQIGLDTLGEHGIVFQNRSIYREMVNLHTTADKLADPEKRKEIVSFIRALNKVQKIYTENPESLDLYNRVAKYIDADPATIKAVWPIHGWRGALAPDIIDVLVKEDPWVANQNRRAGLTLEEIHTLVDKSVSEEAMREA